MAGADYAYCDVCEQKAFYDSDVDYGDACVWVLCGKCKDYFYYVLHDDR